MNGSVKGIPPKIISEIMGRSDAFEVAYKVARLNASLKAAMREPDENLVRDRIQEIMYSTMKIVSPDYSEFLNQPENRTVYYQSFEEHMKEVGLIRISFITPTVSPMQPSQPMEPAVSQ